jgi:hypothetical protein
MGDAENIEAARTMLALARCTAKPGLRNACYRDTGVYLQRLRHDRPKLDFIDLVQTCLPLAASRAYELMAVAKGTRSIAETRKATAARARKHYARNRKALGS